MRKKDLLRICLQNLMRRKSRTFLTVLGVLIGCCSIVIMVSLGIGMRESQERTLAQMGDLTIITVNAPQGGRGKVKLDDALVKRLRALSGVEAVTPKQTLEVESIRLMTEKFPEMLVGAGTVLTTEQVDAAVKAGAKFIVSPGFDPEIVDYCLEKEIPVFPGCITPSEVAQAVKRGLKVVKFFPAEPAGGVSMIKAMAAPYVGIKFMPTGGINAKNLEDYLSFDKIICCGGSWMVKGELVKNGEFDKIRELTAEARKLVDSIRK